MIIFLVIKIWIWYFYYYVYFCWIRFWRVSVSVIYWFYSFLMQFEIAECLEDPVKIHGEAGEGLSFAAGLIYQLAILQAVVRNIERYI